MVWMLYLNDGYEGGETEFLYYKKSSTRTWKVNYMAAHFTHVHRGGLVLEGRICDHRMVWYIGT